MKRLLIIFSLLLVICGRAVASNINVVANEGAWCWFADPRAMHYKNDAGTIDASYVGYIDVHGNIMATQYDYITNQKSDVLIRSAFQPDDHDNPTFLVLPDERIFIIYSRHTDEACFYYRISTRPGDITSLGAEHRLATKNNTTYPSPFILSDDPEHIYLCWRGIGWHPTIAKLSMPDENDEVKFVYGPYQMVQSTGARPYAKYYSNGKDKLYFTYTTGHPDNEDPNWLYFNVVNINGADGPQLEDIDGKKLKTISTGTFAVNKTDSYKSSYPKTVVDATSGRRDWVWQLTCDEAKNPVIAMVKITSDKNTHDYYYAHWDGKAWQKTFLANGGGRFHTSNTEYCYSGGMAIDPDDHHEVYLSCPTNGAYEIWHYTMDDNNQVVAKEQVTDYGKPNDAAAMTGGNVRPFILPGSTGKPMRLMWMNGYYQYWIVKQGYPLGYPTAIHADGEWNETAEIAEPLSDQVGPLKDLQTVVGSPANMGFTLMMNVSLNDAQKDNVLYNSTTVCNVRYAISGGYATLTIDDKTYKSSNKYYTSDRFATNSTGTASDWWDTPIASSWVTITYDGHRFTTYRDGLIDLVVECEDFDSMNEEDACTGLPHASVTDGTLNRLTTWQSCLTPAQVQKQIAKFAVDGIKTSIPATTCTDIVLPAKVGAQAITWTSSHPEIIAPDGSFAFPEEDTDVVLSAVIGTDTHVFTVKAQAFKSLEQNTLFNFPDFSDYLEIDGMAQGYAHGEGPFGTLKLWGYTSRVTDGALDLTDNTATGFAGNGYGVLPEGLLDGLRSYTVMMEVTPKNLDKAPRLYDFGLNSGNSLFCRANTLVAGIKYAGGSTTMTAAGTQLQAGKKQKVAVTYDARTHITRIYLDGKLVASGTENKNEAYMIAQSGTCTRNYVGRTQWWDSSVANDNADFCGLIHSMAMYNTALSEKQVLTLQGYKVADETLNIDCTKYIANPDFEASFSVKSGSGVRSDRAIYEPEGWTAQLTNINENDLTVVDGTCLYANLVSKIPFTQEGGTKAYVVRQNWGTSQIGIAQTLEETLPAGVYELRADVWQSGLGGSLTIWGKPGEREQVSASAPGNAESWQKASLRFVANGIETATIGFTANHTSNGSEKLLGVDNFKLYDVTANATNDELKQLNAVGIHTVVPAATGSTIYDLQGRCIAAPRRGIYIQGGKKLLVK